MTTLTDAQRIRACNHPKNQRTIGPDWCFAGPVSICDQNPAAHGGVTYTVTCRRCGAERRVNQNGNHFERGEWT